MRDPFPGNIIPQNRISAVSKNCAKILGQYYKPQLGTLMNNSFFPFRTRRASTRPSSPPSRITTSHPSSGLSGSFVFVDRPRTLLDQGGAWNFNDPNGGPLSRARLQWVSSHYVRLAHDYTLSPTMMNHIMAAYNRQLNPSTSKHVEENGAAALGINGIAGFNYPQIGGLTGDRVSFPTLGYTANDIGGATAYQFVDTFSWIRGKALVQVRLRLPLERAELAT